MPHRAWSVLAIVAIAAWTGLFAQQASVPTRVDRADLLRDLRTLSADDMQGRQVGTTGGAKARAYVVERFRASGIQPFGQAYEATFRLPGRGAAAATTGTNIIGHLATPARPARYIVVSAHYDHVGVRGGEVFNGANDNASGTAALFAIGRYFVAHPPKHGLIMAAFDGEEAGLVGSRAFVERPPVDRSSIVINVNADMIGRDPNDRLYVIGTYLNPFLKPYVDRVAERSAVRLIAGHDDPRASENWTRDSDHYAFLEAGIPALFFSVEDYGQHHKSTDDFETMTVGFYVNAVETVIQMIEELDANLEAVAARRQP